MLKGDLASFSLAEIFQSLAINNHTGTLKITSPAHPPKLIYFERGEITLFSSGTPGVARVGEMLVRMGKITSQALDSALEEQQKTKELLGEVLVRLELVTEKDVKKALERKIREEIYDLFLWRQGSFEFHMDYFPEDQIDELQKKTRISLNTNSVIMEGLRQLDEWTLIHENIRTFNEILKPTADPYRGDDDFTRKMAAELDGRKPVRDILKEASSGHFECCKCLHELVKQGHAAALSVDELKQLGAREMAERQYNQAASYFQFATEVDPQDAELQGFLGEALASFYQDEAANAAFTKALRLHCEAGDHRRAAEMGEKVLHKTVLAEEDLERLLECYKRLGDAKRATSVAGQIVASFQKRGELRRAADVLEGITSLDPKNLNLRIQVASLLDKAGDKSTATKHLEEVAVLLEEGKRFRELIKILRLLLEINPKRADLKQRISFLQNLQEKLEKRRRRHVTIAGFVAIALLVAAVIPILYEIKAREYFNHAKRLEEISNLSRDFTQAKAAYEEIIKHYSLSTKKAEAQASLERLASMERVSIERLDKDLLRKSSEQSEQLLAMKAAWAQATIAAQAAIEAGNLQAAHEIYAKMRTDYADIASTRELLLPVRIVSNPAAATVSISGKEVGKTPFVHYYESKTKVPLSLTRPGCEPLQESVQLEDQWELRFDLKRRPLGEFQAVVVIQQPMLVSGNLLILPSRDGGLHAIDPHKKIEVWQRTIGRFGDRASNISERLGEVYLGTVSAEATAISASTGNSRWIVRVGASVLAAPGVSDDGKWVAVATTAGTVEIFENETGMPVAKFSTENEILARPIFVGNTVVVGSTDEYLYGYDMLKQELVSMLELGGRVEVDPCASGTTVFVGTAAGTLHAYDAKTHRLAWSSALPEGSNPTCLLVGDSAIYVGCSGGGLRAYDPLTGREAWSATLGTGATSGLCSEAGIIYATLESGRVAAVNTRARALAWDYASDNPILAPPVLLDGLLYFGGQQGKIRYIEAQE